MKKENSLRCSFGCGGTFVSLLTVLFIGLKLTGYIDWSWWWILSPIWISVSSFLLSFIIFTIIYIWLQL